MTTTGSNLHHAIDYVELAVADLDRARSFYGDAFGWTFTDYGPTYAGIRSPDGEGEVGGLAVGDGGGAGGTLVLLYSADLDATVAAVEAAGGTVVDPPYDFPGGRRLVFLDPDGNRLGAWTSARVVRPG